MANITDYPNNLGPHARAGGSNAAGNPSVSVFENTYDIDKGGVTNLDVLTEFLAIPAGSYVLGCQVTVDTIEAVVTIDVGDSADPNGFVAAQALAVAGRFDGTGAYVNTAGAMPKPRYYDADDFLSVTIGGADLVVGKFTIALIVANAG